MNAVKILKLALALTAIVAFSSCEEEEIQLKNCEGCDQVIIVDAD